QRQRETARQEPAQPRRPETRFDARLIYGSLLFDGPGLQQFLKWPAQPMQHMSVDQHQLGQQPRCSAVVERLSPTPPTEEIDVPVPVAASARRELLAQAVGVHLTGAGRLSLAEQLEERLVIESQNPGSLQFQQRVL